MTLNYRHIQALGIIKRIGGHCTVEHVAEDLVNTGTIRKCGCTELAGCEEGCGWTDETKTRCTQCQSRKLET